MRIGLLIYGRLDQHSGGYLYDRKLIEYLKTRGHQVKVISLPWRNYLSHLTDNFSGRLFQRLKKEKIDVLLQDELNHPSLFWLNKRLRPFVHYPIISIVHHLRSSEEHPALLKTFYRGVERKYLRCVDGYIFNSFTTQKVVRSLAPAKRSVVARPAGDRLQPRITTAQLRARAKSPGPLRALFLGNLIRRKAPHVLIEAMALMPPGTVQAVFAGGDQAEPRYARSLRELVSRHELERYVEFGGHTQDQKLAETLRRSQVLVVPSSYEGYGIAYLEGMGFGLPAIGTKAGAAGEIITNGKDGFLIPVGDAIQLARCLTRLHQDRKLLFHLSVASRKRYLNHPKWQDSMRRIANLLSTYN